MAWFAGSVQGVVVQMAKEPSESSGSFPLASLIGNFT